MHSNTERPCPVCGSTDLETIGPILHPRPAFVAGIELELGNVAYSLNACRKCGFQWKHPPIDAELLMNCYRKAKSDNWDMEPDPWQRKFDVLRDVLAAHAKGRRVLDIGCFNGALLKYLGDSWQKFGIEPSQTAAQLAKERGVDILAPSLDEVRAGVPPFDAILAIDVLEHIVEPQPFFQRVSSLMAPRGVFVVMTGDTRSLAWQLQGSAYWYNSLPEHVSFFNQSSLDWVGNSLSLSCAAYLQLRSRRVGVWNWSVGALKSAVYLTGNRARGFGVPALRRQFVERRGPTVQSAKDHLIYVFRKP